MKKQWWTVALCLVLALGLMAGCQSGSSEANSSAAEEATIYGQVTAIEGSRITLALGTLNAGPGGGPDMNGTEEDASGGQMPEIPSDGLKPSGEMPEMPSDGSQPSGEMPELPSEGQVGQNGGQGLQGGPGGGGTMGGIELTGEEMTIVVSDSTAITVQGMEDSTEGALSDIAVDDIVIVTMSGDTVTAITIMQFGGNMPGDGSGQAGSSDQTGSASDADTGTGAYVLADGEALDGGTYTSTNADENAIRAEAVTATLDGVTVEKTDGDASSSDASSFYGLNAAILALDGATLTISGGTVTATAEGANGVFAYDGATITIRDTVINVSGGNAGGIEVAGGGSLYATNLTVNSTVKAAIRSDRGGGTMVVDGGTYTTSGSSGAPAIYSTADITVSNATLTANDSEAVVVEGLNSVTLTGCDVTGSMSGTYGSDGENIHNVMLYQSMSGDAQEGTSRFTMTGGTLVSQNGDMFYVTNTSSVITLSGVDLTLADGTYLLVVAGNDGERGWGEAGANGGICEFNLSSQTVSGDIAVDAISELTMNIANASSYTGAINPDGTAAASLTVTLDSASMWTLTGDSYITAFNSSMDNVITNGYTLYVNGVAFN